MEQLGTLIGCLEQRKHPAKFAFLQGVNKVWDHPDAASAGRLLCKAAYRAMLAADRGLSAPAMHLKLASGAQEWTTHHQDLAACIAQACRRVEETMCKQAGITGVPTASVELGKLLAKLGIGGTAIAGAGAGSLAWMLGRHSSQNTADTEAMERQLEYYRHLSSELEDSMRRKYRYDANNTGQPVTPERTW